MANRRANQLQALSTQLPGANQRVAQGLQQARQIQLQESIKNLQGPGPANAAQQIGAQQQQQAGQINLQAAQQTQNQQTQVGQMALQQQARQQRQQGFDQQLVLTERQNIFANKLNRIRSDTKNQLLDNQLSFQKDRAGQTLFNDRQRLDFVLQKAKSIEEFNNYKQIETQIHQKKLIMLEAAYKKISITLQRGHLKDKQVLDQETQKKLAVAKKELEKRITEEKNRAKNKATQWQAGGQIFGAVVGGIAGTFLGPGAGTAAGATAGATLGATVGGGLGSIFSSI